MRARTLIRVFSTLALIGLGAFTCDDKTATAPAPAPSSELASLQKKLTTADQNLEAAQRENQRLYGNLEQSRDRNVKLYEEQRHLASLSFDLRTSKPFADSVRTQLLDKENKAPSLVGIIRKAMADTYGVFGTEVAVSIMNTAMVYPDVAWSLYRTAKPALAFAVKLASYDFGASVIMPILTKEYSPYVGAIASAQGHSCRWQLSADAEQKTDKCTKIFKEIRAHYGVPVTVDLIEVLGVLHRRYAADESDERKGFKTLFLISRDLYEESRKL